MTAETAILGALACLVGVVLVRVAPLPRRRESTPTVVEEAVRDAEGRRLREAAEAAREQARRLREANANPERRARLDDLGRGL